MELRITGQRLPEIQIQNMALYRFPVEWHEDAEIYLDQKLCLETMNSLLLFINVSACKKKFLQLQGRVYTLDAKSYSRFQFSRYQHILCRNLSVH